MSCYVKYLIIIITLLLLSLFSFKKNCKYICIFWHIPPNGFIDSIIHGGIRGSLWRDGEGRATRVGEGGGGDRPSI